MFFLIILFVQDHPCNSLEISANCSDALEILDAPEMNEHLMKVYSNSPTLVNGLILHRHSKGGASLLFHSLLSSSH
ncbi:hypothetical protein C8Q75DRAFT_456073 [Abortiporus biennis]|nr:hypothetical protein C8Q75DRAFT_456073 [Abortiporus biennis]